MTSGARAVGARTNGVTQAPGYRRLVEEVDEGQSRKAAANGRAKVTVPVDEGETLKSRAQATGEKSSHQRVGRMVGHDRDARLEGRIYDNSVVTMAW